ncbi:type IV pilin protein [uncultured Endozoicomonas sp.]|uniref:type IV pilin protein n=1 Tax=uncultured Endozoicomonas sp. TaxID=432652 RepID=UPI002604ABD9|nr:type IV pilin protein [uncultured Endozoicomonas sp.]
MRSQPNGFSLLELMIVLVIISILASIVLPSYGRYVTESRRKDASTMLLRIMQQQESHYNEELSYTVDLTVLGYGSIVESEGGYYVITASTCGSTPITQCVLLTATPQGAQTGDGVITLNSRGARSPSSHWS